MEPWAAVVSAVAVGLVAGLLVLSGRDYRPVLAPRVSGAPEGISVDATTHRREADHNRSSNTKCSLI
jgi:hypothetical protein